MKGDPEFMRQHAEIFICGTSDLPPGFLPIGKRDLIDVEAFSDIADALSKELGIDYG